jgi:hypothetical protein
VWLVVACGGGAAHPHAAVDGGGGATGAKGGSGGAAAARDAGVDPGDAGDALPSDAAITTGIGAPHDAGVADGGADDGGPGHVIAEPDDEATYVFDQNELRTYNLVIDPADLAAIDMDPSAETYVDGMLEFEGKTYGPLSVRYKGSVGGFLPPCTGAATGGNVSGGGFGTRGGPKTGKCSMKIDFDRIDPELRFYGLKKLNFHSMDRDKSMLRDRLGYAMFREFGVAAPRAMHARLLINGQLEGLYVVVEQIDGRFTHSRFSEGGDGNLYKEVWPVSDTPDPYRAALETNEDKDASVEKMVEFEEAVDMGAEQSFRWLDPQYTFKYIAADRVIINDDGAFHWYCSSNHNYYWYEAERVDRFWLIPWDLDSSFQGGAAFVHINRPWNEAATECTCAGLQMPASCDRLTSEWASRPADYERAVDAFLAGPFADSNVSQKLAAWTAQIDPVVQEAGGLNGAPTYQEWQDAFAVLQSVIQSTRTHRGYAYTADAGP